MDPTYFKDKLKEISDILVQANKLFHDQKSAILEEYDSVLENYQNNNPNIPVYELWKKGNRPGYANESHIKRFTLDNEEAQCWCERKGRSSHWSKERKLKNFDLEDLRKIFPLE